MDKPSVSAAGRYDDQQAVSLLPTRSLGYKYTNELDEITEALVFRIKHYFFNYGFSDQCILRALQREGFRARCRVILQVRMKYGMEQRAQTDQEKQESLNRAITFLHEDLEGDPATLGLGKGLLYRHVRRQAQVMISQRRLYDSYKPTLSSEVAGCRDGSFKQHGAFIVPGPNFLWSLHGYEKLGRVGFQIYCCIDAYSRCIIWFFVGRSATTSIYNLKQYLEAVQRLQMRLFFTRSDHGAEAPLWAAAQACLAKVCSKKLKYTDEDGNSQYYAQGDRLSSCHVYNPSPRNLRIESWWQQRRQGVIERWTTFFDELVGYAIYRESTTADQIAAYAIYGPILRDELACFVDLWNRHTVPTHKSRPNVKACTPMGLYHNTNVPNWGVPFNRDDSSPDQRLLRHMVDPFQHIDIETLLPKDTEEWCDQRLQDIRSEPSLVLVDDPSKPFVREFIQLRDLIERHQKSGDSPILQLTAVRVGDAEKLEHLIRRNYSTNSGLTGSALPSSFQSEISHAHEEDLDID